MIRHSYRFAAEACAELVWRLPALERAFVGLGAKAWTVPGVGRFYRSAAHRLSDRLRAARTPYRPVVVFDRSLVLDVTEFTAGPLYFGGAVYEPATTDVFVRTLEPGHVFVDIGANHGYFTVLAASLVGPTGRVAAFEPNPRVFDQLETHVRMNHFEDRVSLESCALADRPEDRARLYVSQVASNSGLSSLSPNAAALEQRDLTESATVAVTVNTFDRWLETTTLLEQRDAIDLVKIDVEGAEARVIAGMARSLAAGRVRALVVETPWEGPVHRQLCDAGFGARALDHAGVLTNVLFTWGADSGRSDDAVRV